MIPKRDNVIGANCKNLCHVSRVSGTTFPDVGQHVCTLLQEELHVDKHATGGPHQRGGEAELPGHAAGLRGLPVLQECDVHRKVWEWFMEGQQLRADRDMVVAYTDAQHRTNERAAGDIA
ncbi:hypothetical protein CEXT_172531 [Caerostris extrusa]|uniref:Uncharacterized protein n=1 Tax=Caerostris extrusa TaxID=172846 RepID=A0AAV4VKF2_CAEEX|nr:hypothetical protein CEXT_172531 [Caerostris extrusa]